MNDKQIGFNFETETLESAAEIKRAEEEQKKKEEELARARENLESDLLMLFEFYDDGNVISISDVEVINQEEEFDEEDDAEFNDDEEEEFDDEE